MSTPAARRLRVQLCSGETVEIAVSPSTTLVQVRQAVERLSYQGAAFADESKTLAEYGVPDGAVLTMAAAAAPPTDGGGQYQLVMTTDGRRGCSAASAARRPSSL